MAASWPPAEWPITTARRASPLKSAAWRQAQAVACTICRVIQIVILGHSA